MGISGMGNYIGAGLQSIVGGYLVERGADGTAALKMMTFFNEYSVDCLAVFWLGVSALTVLCILITQVAVMRRRKKADALEKLDHARGK